MTRFTTVSDSRLALWLSAVSDVVKCFPEMKTEGSRSRQNQILTHAMVQGAVRHAQISSTSGNILNLEFPNPEDPTAHISHLSFVLANAKLQNADQEAAKTEKELERLYSDRDPHWSECVLNYIEYYWLLRKPHYRDWKEQGASNPDYSVILNRLPNDAKVGLISDWGTGMPDAVKLATAILELGVDAVIHLGDVYYAGTNGEFQHHVVDAFETAFQNSGRRVPVFSIPGNHDYYAGGRGFYDQVLKLNSSGELHTGWEQDASYFCLRTEDNMWQFLGMDTGLNGRFIIQDELENPRPPYLEPSELEWHHDKLSREQFSGASILLSHHQLFSQHNVLDSESTAPWVNEHLHQSFHPFFDRISVWFWGHEHNLALFENGIFNLPKGRLIGCSAYEESGDPYAPVSPSYVQHVPYMETEENWRVSPSSENPEYYNHAFGVLDFKREDKRDSISCTYYEFPSWGDVLPENCTPRVLYRESIYPAVNSEKPVSSSKTT